MEISLEAEARVFQLSPEHKKWLKKYLLKWNKISKGMATVLKDGHKLLYFMKNFNKIYKFH